MEGQFATHALLVEQQHRIKTLEAELAQTQLEVMRLRSQVNPSNNPPPPPHDPSAQHLHLMAATALPTPLHLSRSEAPSASHPISMAAATHAAGAAALPQIPPQSSALSTTQLQQQQGVVVRGAMQTVHNVPHQPQQHEEQKKASSRYWTADEHSRFLEGLEMYGQKDIKAISRHVGTRSATQVRTHAQKYYLRIERERAKAEQEGKPPSVVHGSNTNNDHKVANGKHSSVGRSGVVVNSAQGRRAQKGSSKHIPNGTHEDTMFDAGRIIATHTEGGGKREEEEKHISVGIAQNEASSNSQSGAGAGSGLEDANSPAGISAKDNKTCEEQRGQQDGARDEMEQGTVKTETLVGNHNEASSDVARDSHVNSDQQGLAASRSHNAIPLDAIDSTNSSCARTEGRSELPIPQLPYSSRPFSHDTSGIGPVNDSGPSRVVRLQSMAEQPATSDYANDMSHAKNERTDAVPAEPRSESKAPLLSLKNSNLPHAMAHTDLHQVAFKNGPNIKEENELGGEVGGEFGKRPSPQPMRKSPKKRMKKSSALATLPPSSSAALPLASANTPPPNLPRPNTLTASIGLSGAPSRPMESKLYNHVENSGSMSNIRALLRVPNEDQGPGPSGSKPPTLRRNESSNSVLADLSKNVGVLSRSNSFISPSGKGVTRSNSILSLLSGLPTAMRESPSTDRLLMLDSGEDRVMATLKAMDTGNSGAVTLQPGPSTPGQTPRVSMGDRSFSFSQLQHIGLDDLEDPSAVALALQEEQKWENG